MKIAKIKEALWGTPTFTWAGHAYVTAIPALVVMAVLVHAGVIENTDHAQVGYVGLTFAVALFYAFREQSDEMHHRLRKDYDLPQAHQGVLSSRIDKVGDSFGPFLTVIVAGATVSLSIPWLSLALAAGATFALGRAAVRIVRRHHDRPSG